MIGFHDHIIDRRSGRPLPHHSWRSERYITWTVWASAAISSAGAIHYYVKWQDWSGPAWMGSAALLLAGIAYWRGKLLDRKSAALLRAVEDYEALLAKQSA